MIGGFLTMFTNTDYRMSSRQSGIWLLVFCFFFKQKTAYEMRISDWSSYLCSSDLFAKKINDMTGGKLKIEVLPAGAVVPAFALLDRSEERCVGKESVSTCRSRWSP